MAAGLDLETLTAPHRRVLLAALRAGRASRTGLATRLGLSTPSLTRLTAPLLAAGLLEPDDAGPAAGAGRPRVPLRVPPDLEHFVGVSITLDGVEVVLTDVGANVLDRAGEPLLDADPRAAVDQLAGITARLRAGTTAPVRALGIALGGTAVEGHVQESRFLGWRDVPLAALVSERTGLRAHLANDVYALTQAEHWFGAGRDHRQFLLVTIGRGIGFGAVGGDEVLAGPDLGRGGIGHVPLPAGDGVAPASALLTTAALRERADRLGLPPGDPYDALRAAADAGRTEAARELAEAARALGALLAVAAVFTLPEAIVVAGEGAPLVRERDALRAGLAAAAPGLQEPPILERAHDFGHWARGAAAIAIRERVLG